MDEAGIDLQVLSLTTLVGSLQAATARRVPIYIHPAPPPTAVKNAYFSGLPGETGLVLSIAGWGWHA
ncbi:MAG: hypothetical protein WB919_18690, partial [Candidatus Sulfotelmatobacter sp.]